MSVSDSLIQHEINCLISTTGNEHHVLKLIYCYYNNILIKEEAYVRNMTRNRSLFKTYIALFKSNITVVGKIDWTMSSTIS